MSKSRQEILAESRKKGVVTVATVALGVTIGWPIAAVAGVPAAVLGWRWWKHRGENGIRF